MDKTGICMADIDRLREFIDSANEAPRDKFVIVLPSEVMVDIAKEADRTAITKLTRDADGAIHYEVGQMREGVEKTAQVCEFIAILREVRFIEAPRFQLEKPRPPKLTPAERMAQLRRFAGQDWRGRK
mgnify:FL=1